MKMSAKRVMTAAVVGVLLGVLWGCGQTRLERAADPLRIVADRGSSTSERLKAAAMSRERDGDDVVAVRSTATEFVRVIWSAAEPAPLRIGLLRGLLADPIPEIVTETREVARQLLAREPAPEMVEFICHRAGQGGWTEFIAPAVRSWARDLPRVIEPRPERLMIEAVSGGRSVEEVVFEEFIKPEETPSTMGVDWTGRLQRDAWEVLCRMDPDGALRRGLVESDAAASERGEAARAAVRDGLRDLRVLPGSGAELEWLLSLHEPRNRENAAWWRQAREAVAGCAAGETLGLRHVEAVRWTHERVGQRLNQSKEELLGELTRRVATRRTVNRETRTMRKYQEALSRQAGVLTRADLLVLLAVDDNLRREGVAESLLRQAAIDRADLRTEYGGVMELSAQDPAVYVLVLYPPRPQQFQGDITFVASEDLIEGSDRALAHYHFHAQEVRNGAAAGPSEGDLKYADRMRRTCLVLTQVSRRSLDVDFYQPGGVVVDLGVLEAGGE